MNTLQIVATAIGMVSTVAGGGYFAATTLDGKADREEVLAVNSKTDYIMDRQAESLLAQINRLESKPSKTADDRQQLQYLRDELQRLREIRQRRGGKE